MCAPPDGQTQCIHEFHLVLARAVVVEQARYILDLHRQLAGEPMTFDPLAAESPPTAI